MYLLNTFDLFRNVEISTRNLNKVKARFEQCLDDLGKQEIKEAELK